MVADVTNNIFSITSGDATGLKVQYSGLGQMHQFTMVKAQLID